MTSWLNRSKYKITLDKEEIDFSVLHNYLSKESYWSQGITIEIVKKAVENSICFSILSPSHDFVGFARMITDSATFGYLADVFVLDDHKGKGLGKWLMEVITSYPGFQILRNWFLYTKDAHSFYERFGWQKIKHLDHAEKAMVKSLRAADLY